MIESKRQIFVSKLVSLFFEWIFDVDEFMNLTASCFLTSTSFDDDFKGDVSEKDEDSKMSQISEHKTGYNQ